jgi:hypothetical protein
VPVAAIATRDCALTVLALAVKPEGEGGSMALGGWGGTAERDEQREQRYRGTEDSAPDGVIRDHRFRP